MAIRWIKDKPRTVAEQIYWMRVFFPQFRATTNRGKLVRWVGDLQPTALSDRYTVEIKYDLPHRPDLRVLHPELKIHPNYSVLPHAFKGNLLCVHTAAEWRGEFLIARTLVPWISTWLYFYEVWLSTGLWLGEGTHEQLPQHRSSSDGGDTPWEPAGEFVPEEES